MHPEQLTNALAQLSHQQLRRTAHCVESVQGTHLTLHGTPHLAFASNDYLGLAANPALVTALQQGAAQWGVGGGSAHLVCGHMTPHHVLEQQLAAWIEHPAALLFSDGYLASLGAIPALVGRNDAVFVDRLVHASINDACVLSRARLRRFRHNDLDHLASLLANTPAHSRLIAVDAVYSMDGDEAPLADLLALAERYQAWLYVDDAHGFGVLGQGRGSLAEQGLTHTPRLIYMATLGKAAGVSGAFIAGSPELIDWLINRAHSYIYTTSSSPALACALHRSLDLIAQSAAQRAHLAALIQHFRAGMQSLPWPLTPSRTPIQALIVGSSADALVLSAALAEQHIWVPAIRPPTVPHGQARLRVSFSAQHTFAEVDVLINALRQLGSPCINQG